jgi:pyruvate/2-oxoglutarate dehydrogenase complex dihydrolipoamide acyltransferase (E2) component
VGLITPIVRGVEAKGVRTISDEIKVLGKKARDGKYMNSIALLITD